MTDQQPSNALFCFGLGYSASRLARRCAAMGWRVAGTRRSADAPNEFETVEFDRNRPLARDAAALDGATHLLNSVPPDADSDAVLSCHGGHIEALSGPQGAGLQWVGYLSTTAVYGDHGGGWVDEDTAAAPVGARGRARVAAEAGWLDLWRRAGVPVHIFRLAGIYGPGRSVLDQLRGGTARRIIKPGHLFSRIHVDDLVTVLTASMARPNPGAVYNVCDDMPAASSEVMEFAAQLLGMAPPPEIPFAEAELSPMAASFYADNKRVRNLRIKDELGVELAYPDYRAGLKALAAAE